MKMYFKFDYVAQCFIIFAKKRVNANYDELVKYGVELDAVFRSKSDKSVIQLRNKLKNVWRLLLLGRWKVDWIDDSIDSYSYCLIICKLSPTQLVTEISKI